jgi:hypothetical protein
MIGNLLWLSLFVVIAAFVDWRLWNAITSKRAAVKGWVFERSEQPAHYWAAVGLNVVAALMLSALAAVLVLGMAFKS